MGLPWVRLDTAFPMNHKVLTLVEDKKWRAITTYVCGLSYAGAQGTDGFLTAGCLPFLHATKKEAEQLVQVALWLPRTGGWLIHDWLDFQPSSEESALRSKRAQDAARIRWHGTEDAANG